MLTNAGTKRRAIYNLETDKRRMYIPKNYLATDKAEIIAFMKQFSFATIITAKDNLPVATHLPFYGVCQRRRGCFNRTFCKSK
jgi:hypothetical protein